jgi:hypothetical protein
MGELVIRVTGREKVVDAQAAHYCVAGQPLVCQSAMPGLADYANGLATPSFTELLTKFIERPILTAANSKLRYFGRAYFDGDFREVRYWRHGCRGQLDINGIPACEIDFAELHIHVLNDEPLGVGLNLEIITGPALVLLLNQQQIYCMHAGAVDTPVGRIGIVAESGAGKSTLSRHLDPHWSQVSDDIMPLSISKKESAILVLPDFPQLKMPNNSVTDAPKMKQQLDYLLRVDPVPSVDIHFDVLPRTQAMLQVVRHTVAAKLFDTNTLQQHAEFAKTVTSCVPVIQISYPRDMEQLSNVRSSIIEYLGGI